MKMSIEAAMEIWKAGGGVAASEWQERSGYSRGGPIYRRRPTPVFCKEMERSEVESWIATGLHDTITSFYKDVLDRVSKRFLKVRKLIVVSDPVGLVNACREAEKPEPRFDALADRWDVGTTIASQKVWKAEGLKAKEAETNLDLPGLGPWAAFVKKSLAPVPALGS